MSSERLDQSAHPILRSWQKAAQKSAESQTSACRDRQAEAALRAEVIRIIRAEPSRSILTAEGQWVTDGTNIDIEPMPRFSINIPYPGAAPDPEDDGEEADFTPTRFNPSFVTTGELTRAALAADGVAQAGGML